MTTIYQCNHVTTNLMRATTTVTHRAIPGRRLESDDLDTETNLCAICSGLMVSFLQHLEAGIEPSDAIPKALAALQRVKVDE